MLKRTVGSTQLLEQGEEPCLLGSRGSQAGDDAVRRAEGMLCLGALVHRHCVLCPVHTRHSGPKFGRPCHVRLQMLTTIDVVIRPDDDY